MKEGKAYLIVNSDFGVQNTIGVRTKYVAEQLVREKNEVEVFCRGYEKGEESRFEITKVLFAGSFLMKALTALRIYIHEGLPTDSIKIMLFDSLLVRKLRKSNLDKVTIVHSWEPLPKSFKYLKKQNPRIKIIQDIPMAFPSILHKLKGKKFEGQIFESPKYFKDSMKYTDAFIAPSEFVKQSLLEEGVARKKILTVPFGVDIKRFKPLQKKRYDGHFKAAFMGNINNRKGINYLVEAWKGLNLKNAELNLYGRLYPEAIKYLKDAKRHNIKIHGFVDVAKEISKNHIYVFPSTMEGSSKSNYEAMASGLPVITTFNSGPVVRDGEEGFIIPIKDKKAIKEKILFFYNNRRKIISFGRKARKRAEQFTWENYSRNVTKVYEKVMK